MRLEKEGALWILIVFAAVVLSLALSRDQELPNAKTAKQTPLNSPQTRRSNSQTAQRSDTKQDPGSKYFESLPDKPVQLVRPDPTEHQKLEIIVENVRHLHHINTAVAVVAVVGKFHSGKSFLLNQLMGKQDGFGIGPYVRPQTMGIWMWGKPLDIKLPSGEPLSVIFLDTEGFAANNISETYDAKIFSVATLLSSYLLYNSVKIIDQGDIDYLELLARRTQLFALRSQITKSQWFDEFNHDLLSFPPLVWVVQDFVQMTEDEETPQEWLHRIMDTSSREASDYNINLLGIFDTVDCHTLFLPATKKALLQDLSKASEEDLTAEYREERDRLIQRLKSGLVPKEKNGRPITGPELASLLEVLVSAANEGSLAEIPGRWEVFIDQLKVSTLEDCLTFYESNMAVIHKKYDNGPINETELELWHQSSLVMAEDLLKQLLFGLEDATEEALEGLEASVREMFEKAQNLNDKKIQLKCSEVQRRVELQAEEELHHLVYPLKTTALEKKHVEIKERGVEAYKQLVEYLSDNKAFARNLEQLKTSLGYIFKATLLKNNEAIEVGFRACTEEALVKFRQLIKNTNRIPRTTVAFKKVVEAAAPEARKVFEQECEDFEVESLYSTFLGQLKTKLFEEAGVFHKDNLHLIRTVCETLVVELMGNFRQNTGSNKLILPVKSEYLDERLLDEKKTALKNYENTQSEFADTAAFTEVKSSLSSQLELLCEQRREENMEAYFHEVEVPLNTAMKLIKLSADRYDTVFSVTQYMKEVCMLNLDEGKAKDWDESLKETISEKFIQNSQELQEIINSKRGFVSTLKGLWQWFLWTILGRRRL